MVERVFSQPLFGPRLARILDALYAFHSAHHRTCYALRPQLGLFTVPTGRSFYEADCLTRHYYMRPSELMFALQENRVPGARQALGWSDDMCPGAFMHEVRQMLRDRVMPTAERTGVARRGATA